MAIKLAVAVLAALTVVAAYSEKAKRQSDLSEYFNQFQEQMKPITGQLPSFPSGQFPSLPNGQLPSFPTGQLPSLPNGQLPSLPNGFGSLPSFPGMGSGSSGSNSQYKRQVGSNDMSEWFNQLQEAGNNFSGNFPLKPLLGQFPFPGSSSGSSETSESQNP